MFEAFNKVLFYFKVILLLLVFTLTLYIMLAMNSYYHHQILDIILIFIPMLMVLIIFVVSFFFKEGDDNTIFNVGCLLALIAILIIDYRTIYDKNMVMWLKGNLNFYYFQNHMMQIKMLSYCIFVGNILLINKTKHENIKN